VGGNARLRVFSERAIRAVLDPNCANLPLPQPMLGQTRVFTFRFRP
jgi:neural Wiskott-Aldrich syndrome protein